MFNGWKGRIEAISTRIRNRTMLEAMIIAVLVGAAAMHLLAVGLPLVTVAAGTVRSNIQDVMIDHWTIILMASGFAGVILHGACRFILDKTGSDTLWSLLSNDRIKITAHSRREFALDVGTGAGLFLLAMSVSWGVMALIEKAAQFLGHAAQLITAHPVTMVAALVALVALYIYCAYHRYFRIGW